MKLKLNTDGCSIGNPGAIGMGVVLFDEDDEVIASESKKDGKGTSNEAEYKALLYGTHFLLNSINDLQIRPTHINFRLDSELVVKQINGEYQCKNPRMKKLCKKCSANIEYIRKFFPVDVCHVPREKNKKADELSRHAVGRKR